MSKPMVQRLLISDILERPFFQQAKVIASDQALDRTVTWVHIMEVTNVGKLLNGNELILSTGIAWKDNEEVLISFLEQLIEKKAAGLVIELVNYTKKIPNAALHLAKAHDFPLILFYDEVRYIDITQDLHAIFLHQHHQMVSKLEKLSVVLNESLLSGHGIGKLMNDFHQFTSLELILFPIQGKPIFVPSCPKEVRDGYIQQWQADNNGFIQNFHTNTYRCIYLLGQTFAYLFVRPKEGLELTEFETLALDRGATAVAQEVMRTMYYEEQRRHKDDTWVQKWLTGDISEEELKAGLKGVVGVRIPKITVTIVCEINDSKNTKDDSHFLSNIMIARSLFEDRHFKVIISKFHNQIVFVLFPPNLIQDEIHHEITDVFKLLQKGTGSYFGSYGIGQFINNLNVNKSYKSAKTVLRVQQRLGNLVIPAYEYLHSYRTIALMDEAGTLEEYVHFYLGDLEDSPKEKDKHLLQTLKYYLLHSGKKNDTANSLFIVRQTLYHRLEKIEGIIGDIYSSHEKRLAIELAILGYEYLYGTLEN
ncbi:PucR family transcriptional regulator [Halalkalibacter alkaliphilus]|uniref:PucR family transcriptional regulator n=1 Tax=Halalkalibacter alkaliphilus TaxID=2917993 RepID=A0A9X1ZUB7_9BACI|nr:PucR family transcriptional regulator [Halalkalibacter alkaliphilus]MCL7745669.1 PucR family transcriptional regulator [Halalkalibacter alkaliphilus]